jgi:hypothetical protein
MPEGDQQTGGETKTGTEGEPQTFTQDDLNRIATKEKADGRKSGRQELLRDLGVESEDDIKSLLEAKRKEDDEKLEETEREKRARERAESERDQAKAEAAQAKQTARVEKAMLAAGVPLGVVDRATKMVDLEADADDDAIKAAVEQLKGDLPQLFAPAAEGSQEGDKPGGEKPPASGSPSSIPPKPPTTGHEGKSAKDQARELLEQRHPEKFRQTAAS